MESKNKFLAISLAALAAISAMLFVFTSGTSKPEIDKNYFKPVEPETINQITLSSPHGDVQLKFENKRWLVNDKWDADDQMIKVLLATFLQAEPKRPVAAVVKDSVINELSRTGTRVVISAGGEIIMKFLAGGNTEKTEAWFLKEGETQPFVMAIPGYRVYVSGILEMGASEWRNKRVFDFNWRNFKSLKASYLKEPKEGFEIGMIERYPAIQNMPKIDTTKLNDYIDNVSLLFASRFISPGQSHIDSLTATSPVVRIEVRDIADRVYILELFTPQRSDMETYGRIGEEQVVAFEKNKISEIVRRRGYFAPVGSK